MNVRKWIVQFALLAAVALPCGAAETPLPAPGDRIGDLAFQDLYYKTVHLGDWDERRAYVLFFFSNTCPVARRYMTRVGELEARFREDGVQFVAVNVSPADTVVDVAQHALTYCLAFPVVKDATFDAVRALGVTRTPEVVVLDQDLVLRYRGRVDDQYRLGGVKPRASQSDLARAVEEILAGQSVSRPLTQAEGCIVTFPLLPTPGAPLTFEADVKPVLAQYCLNCHTPGGPAPFALDTPDAFRMRKDALLEALQLDRMPPSYADRENPLLALHRLPYREQHRMANWLSQDPEGGPTAPPAARTGSMPDTPAGTTVYHASAPVPLDHVTQPVDVPLEPPLPSETWVQSMAVRGDYVRGFRWAQVYAYFPSDPGTRRPVTGPILPGLPLQWNAGNAMRLPAGAMLGLTVHYVGDIAPASDMPALLLQAATEPVTAEVTYQSLEASLDPGPQMLLPGGAEQSARSILAVSVRLPEGGTALTLHADSPSGEPITLLSIPAYDPAWPLTYYFIGDLPPLAPGTPFRVEVLHPRYLLGPASKGEVPLGERSDAGLDLYWAHPVNPSVSSDELAGR